MDLYYVQKLRFLSLQSFLKKPKSFSNKFHFHKFQQVDDKESCLVQPLRCLILPPTNGRNYQIYPARGFSQIMSGQEHVQSVLGGSNSQHLRGSLRLVRCLTLQHRIVRYTIQHSTCCNVFEPHIIEKRTMFNQHFINALMIYKSLFEYFYF